MNYRIENVEGYFDCRQYKANTPRSSRIMIENGGRIIFSVAFMDEELEQHPELKDFANKSEKSGLNFVGFKIFPKNCKLFTASAKQIEFPDNNLIDGGRFEANLVYSVKHGVGTELNGCYVNAMQIIRRADNPFDVVEDGNEDWLVEKIVRDVFPNADAILNEKDKSKKKETKKVDEEVNDLPF